VRIERLILKVEKERKKAPFKIKEKKDKQKRGRKK